MNNSSIIFDAIFLSIISMFPGPVALLLLISYAKKKNLSIVHLVFLFIVDGLSLLIINTTTYLRSYDLAFWIISYAIAISWLILRFSWKTLMQIGEEDLEFQKRINIGVFSVLFLQAIILTIVLGINAR